MCVLLCEHGIACALRWGVALVGVILTSIAHPIVRPSFRCWVYTNGWRSDEAVIVKKVDMWP